MKSTGMSPSKKATLLTSGTALLLIIVKFTVGILTGTVSVLASAVDSLLDFLISTFNVFAVHNTEKPNDEAYNYGRGKIEGIASALEGLFIIISALFIIEQSILKWMNPEIIPKKDLLIAMAVMAFSMMITLVLVLTLKRLMKGSKSLVVQADALHYKTDLITNAGVLLVLFLIRLTGYQWLDPFIATAMALYITSSALPLVTRGWQMLLDRALESSLVDKIKSIAENSSDKINGFHELKTRHSGNTNFVEFHLVFDESITLLEAHHIGDEIEAKIRALENCPWVINVHLDPVDDSHRDQKWARRR